SGVATAGEIDAKDRAPGAARGERRPKSKIAGSAIVRIAGRSEEKGVKTRAGQELRVLRPLERSSIVGLRRRVCVKRAEAVDVGVVDRDPCHRPGAPERVQL